MITRAKILKAPETAAPVPLQRAQSPSNRARVVRRVLVEADEQARELLGKATAQARQLIEDAQRAATVLRAAASEEGRAQGYAEVLSRFAALERLEAETDERALTRNVELARILAERLIGEAIAADRNTVVALATRVLSEVRGARQIELHANPADVAVLEPHVRQGNLSGLTLVPDATCPGGNFRVVTELGSIDAQIGPRLDLLAAKLAETLRKGN